VRFLKTLIAGSARTSSRIEPEDEVVFYPTYAFQSEGHWEVFARGCVYRTSQRHLRRTTAFALLRKALQVGRNTTAEAIFRTRSRLFSAANQRDKHVEIQLGQRRFVLGPSKANGHFSGHLHLSPREASGLWSGGTEGGWAEYQALLENGDQRQLRGSVHFIRRHGLSLISDIDDTIKVTHAASRRKMLNSTFLQEFEPVPGMAGLYQDMAQMDVAIHYVSASPWPLFLPLTEFLSGHGYPSGTFHLKHFRFKSPKEVNVLESPLESKPRYIADIFSAFPQRKFILIGDSGQHDPEIYGSLARYRQEQVAGIFIRNVSGEKSASPRFAEAFAGLDRKLWHVFQQPAEIRDLLLERAHLGLASSAT